MTEEPNPQITTKDVYKFLGRFIYEKRLNLLGWMAFLVILGALGGTIHYLLHPAGQPSAIFPRAVIGVVITAFVGVGVYTFLVPVFMLFGPNRRLGWIGLPPFVLKLGIVSRGTYLLIFAIGVFL